MDGLSVSALWIALQLATAPGIYLSAEGTVLDQEVYLTRMNAVRTYHRDNCREIVGACSPMLSSTALSMGASPCPICEPDLADGASRDDWQRPCQVVRRPARPVQWIGGTDWAPPAGTTYTLPGGATMTFLGSFPRRPVHVDPYYRSDGTYVRGHYRRYPRR